jgi:2,4-dienoyl-CoA reductase-like NADH-dependent reductase (Old Yellow Enzyme family)
MVGQFIVHLLRDVEKYLKNSNTPAARFGREAMGDPRFVFDLRNGREPRAQTIKRVRAFLETAV